MTYDNTQVTKKQGFTFYLSQVVNNLVSIHFGSHRLGHTMKATCTKFFNVEPDICAIFIF